MRHARPLPSAATRPIALFVALVLACIGGAALAAAVAGDANNDTYITTNDITTVREQLLGIANAPGAPDANSDSKVNIADVVYLANKLKGVVPDTEDVAGVLKPTERPTFYSQYNFLVTGNPPKQTGFQSGALDPASVALLHGRVLNHAGRGLYNVVIDVLDAPKLGQTRSAPDGSFDLLVPGGAQATIRYTLSGYLPAQRTVTAPVNDFLCLPDVALKQLDSAVTTVSMTPTAKAQVAVSNEVGDEDGSRTATLIINAATQAVLRRSNGTTVTASSLHVRATEYTVGANGPKLMPAELPKTSNYTYAVELSADEAQTSATVGVEFSKPMAFYVEDFVGFPVGIAVPVAYYDRQKGAWVPTADGRVVRILSVAGGLAQIDINGAGKPATADQLTSLGVTTDELQKLATLYATGTTLWRAPVRHFSPYDLNYGVSAPLNAQQPQLPNINPTNPNQIANPTTQPGHGTIEQETQYFLETIPIAGTPFTLNYSSERVPGNLATKTIKIPLIGSTVDSRMKEIKLAVEVAGVLLEKSFAPAPNLSHTFVWDGKDAFGRELQGLWPATVTVSYVYPAYYNMPPSMSASFGFPSGQRVPGDVPARRDIALSQILQTNVGSWSQRDTGFGGWSISVYHAYDAVGGYLSYGDGRRRSMQSMNYCVFEHVAGGGTLVGAAGDGKPATETRLQYVSSIEAGPEGSVYIGEVGTGKHMIRRVTPDGAMTTFAGTGTEGFSPDGTLAKNANLSYPSAITVSPDGRVYFMDGNNGLYRMIDLEGKLHTVAGMRSGGTFKNGVSALETRLDGVNDAAIAPDGTIFLTSNGGTDSPLDCVRRIGPDGIINIVAGGVELTYPDIGDGGPATRADLESPQQLALGPDGSLYILDSSQDRLRRVGPDGIITTVAGGGDTWYPTYGDGGPATEAEFITADTMAVNSVGNLYIGDGFESRIRLVTGDGIIRSIAGGADADIQPGLANGLPPLSVDVHPDSLSIDPNGVLYSLERFSNGDYVVCRIRSLLPGLAVGESLVPDVTGSRIYRFNANGQLVQTLDFLTGAELYHFTCDANGELTEIVDGYGSRTVINRDSAGTPTSIVAPNGQRTNLTFNANGYLETIANPAGEKYQFAYTGSGLMTQVKGPRNNVFDQAYTDTGLLQRADDPEGGFDTLARTDSGIGYNVSLASGLDRRTSITLERLLNGDEKRLTEFPDHTRQLENRAADQSTQTSSFPNGMTSTIQTGPDPRFDMQVPVTTSAIRKTPSGLTSEIATQRTAKVSDTNNPLSLVAQTDLVTINDFVTTTTFNVATMTATEISAAGRVGSVKYDGRRLPLQENKPGQSPIYYTYDSRGRLTGVKQDERTTSMSYDGAGQLASVTNGLNQAQTFEYNAAGRMVRHNQPEGRVIKYEYDAAGNIASITPPGRSAHLMTWTGVNLLKTYTPPGSQPFTNTWNVDRDRTRVTYPSGIMTDFNFNAAGQLASTIFNGGTISRVYNATTGQLSTITAPGGVVLNYTHDGILCKAMSWTGPVAGSVQRLFDTNFRYATQKVNNADPVSFAYDRDGLVTTAGALAIGRTVAHEEVTSTVLGGVKDTFTYNGFGEVATYDASFGATKLIHLACTRDKLGRISSRTEQIGGEAANTYGYTYDGVGRLKTVTLNGAPRSSYTYDLNGNRLTGPGAETGTYDGLDRVLTYGGATYTFNPNGTLTQRVAGSATTQYAYESNGNLREVTLPDARVIHYEIDGVGQRVGKRVNGTLTKGWLYLDEGRVIAELDGAGAVVSRFVYGTRRNVPDHMIRGGVAYRIIPDHLDSPRLVVNTVSGEVAQRITYDEFGRVTGDTNPGFQPFGFGGGLYDADTGLVRFGSRDYDPQTGRWTSYDPVLFGGRDTNLYAYVFNDPVNQTDVGGQGPTNIQTLPDGTRREVLGTLSGQNMKTFRQGDNIVVVNGQIQFVKDTLPGGGERYRMIPVGPNDFGALINEKTGMGRMVQNNSSLSRFKTSGGLMTDNLGADTLFVLTPSSSITCGIPGSNRNILFGADANGAVYIQTGVLKQ